MTDLDQIEIQISVAKEMIALRDDYIKLAENKHFKTVIENGYFKEEASRLVMAKGNPTLNSEQRDSVDNMIYGVGALANYLDMIARRGAEMDIALSGHEETREEILAEEAA